jgi:magnesium-protoporphyrin O-methyltransferase
MSCCVANHVAGAERFFSWFAARYRKRYRKQGLEFTQRQLLQGLIRNELTGATVLEPGCGIGYLHQALLRYGAVSATGVDLTHAMIDQARAQAHENGLEKRVQYRCADFVDIAGELPRHDIVVLDKVLCCYPDAPALLDAAAGRSARVLALTYPRPHLLARLAMVLGAAFTRMIGCGFRGYVHDPAMVHDHLRGHGLRRSYADRSFMWLTEVYERDSFTAPLLAR